MDYTDDHEDPNTWPPGTVPLEKLLQSGKQEIILQPHPSGDPNDPLNWTPWQKNWNFFLTCYYTLMVFTLIDAATVTWGPMQDELGFSFDILNDSYAIGCGTLCIGAFLLIPFALKYGRRPIYILSTAVQFAMCIWSAKLMNVADLMNVNVWSCLVGALGEVLVQMTVADIFFVHQRGAMNTIFVWAQNAGSTLTVTAAGYITVGQGWRWVWWWCGIFFAVGLVLFVFAYEETKYTGQTSDAVEPDMQQDSVAVNERVRAGSTAEKRGQDEKTTAPTLPLEVNEPATTNTSLARTHINPSIPRKTYLQRLSMTTTSPGSFAKFARHSYQPFQMLFLIPAVGYMSLVYSFVNAWSVIETTTLSIYMILPPYNFDAAAVGLMSLPAFIGITLGSLACGPLADRMILWLARRNRGIYEPEMRLWVMAPFVPFVPAGALMFGCGLNTGAPWPLIAVGYAVCNFGMAPLMSISLTYLTDSYTEVSSPTDISLRLLTGTDCG